MKSFIIENFFSTVIVSKIPVAKDAKRHLFCFLNARHIVSKIPTMIQILQQKKAKKYNFTENNQKKNPSEQKGCNYFVFSDESNFCTTVKM